jgi:imidazolonepropionase
MEKTTADLVVLNAAQVVKISDDRKGPRRGTRQGEIDVIENGAIAVKDGKIIAVAPTSEIIRDYDVKEAEVIDARGKIVLPGLVDAHTHPIFGGIRFDEYAKRLGGKSLSEVAAEGGGMTWAFAKTASTSDAQLLAATVAIFQDMLKAGTTAVEAKSGYGKTVAEELRLLELINEASNATPMNVVPTFLGAHAVPSGMQAEEYVATVINDMFPAVAAQGIAKYCDATCETGWFTNDQCLRVLRRGAALGMPGRLHVDAFASSGGWRTANIAKAVCADHLTYTSDAEIEQVGPTETIAVIMPAAELYYLLDRRAHARKLIQTGVPVALATDFCSSIRAISLLQALPLAAPWFLMTPEETIVAATLNGAYAVGMADSIGSLDVGKRADFIILDIPHYRMAIFEMGANRIDKVVAGGNVVI